VICWSAVVTFIIMQLIKLVLRGARYKDEILEVGDLAIHGEEAFPEERFAERIGVQSMAGDAGLGGGGGSGGGAVQVSARVEDEIAGSRPGDLPPPALSGR
jgi:hypothetical protein